MSVFGRVRPGRAADLTAVMELWKADVRAGRRDSVPGGVNLLAMSGRFDWDAKSRVFEEPTGLLAGAVFVTSRATPEGVLANIDVAGSGEAALELIRWALRFSRAAGGALANLFAGRGHGEGLVELGFTRVRPWWRMDRSLAGTLPEVVPVAGYDLIDRRSAARGTWAQMHNLSFADHWRFAPRTEDELLAGKAPEMCLMALTVAEHAPAAITICHVETFEGDARPQPVGLVSSVGTIPEHRRRGLARWLVSEGLVRLRDAGARIASLYVDGWNENRAPETYVKLGFHLAFEAEVWEIGLA